MDADKSLESKLREILGYLNTLGINIQKRTQHLLDNRINERYLSSGKNLEKVVEKVNTICDLSVASLQKVNNGVKITVKNGKSRLQPKESGEGSFNQQKTHKKSESRDIRQTHKSESRDIQQTHKSESGDIQQTHKSESGDIQRTHKSESGDIQRTHKSESGDIQQTHKSESRDNNRSSSSSQSLLNTTEKSETDQIKKIESKKKKTVVGNVDIFLPNEVVLNNYSNCSVKLSSEDSDAVLNFTPLKRISPKKDKDNLNRDDNLAVIDNSKYLSSKGKHKFRIKSRPRNHHTHEKMNSQSEGNSPKRGSGEKSDEISERKTNKPYSRIICNNSSSDDDTKSCALDRNSVNSETTAITNDKNSNHNSSNLSNECNDSKIQQSESSEISSTKDETSEKSCNNLSTSVIDTSRSKELESEQIKNSDKESVCEDHERESQLVSSDKLSNVSHSIAARDDNKMDIEKNHKHSSEKQTAKRSEKNTNHSSKSKKLDEKLATKEKERHKKKNSKKDAEISIEKKSELVPNEIPPNDVDHLQEDILNSKSVETTVEDPKKDNPNSISVEATDAVDHLQDDIPKLKSVQTTDAVEDPQKDIPNSKSVELTDVVDHLQDDIPNSKSAETTDNLNPVQEEVLNSKSFETTDNLNHLQEDIPNSKSVETTDAEEDSQKETLISKPVGISDASKIDQEHRKKKALKLKKNSVGDLEKKKTQETESIENSVSGLEKKKPQETESIENSVSGLDKKKPQETESIENSVSGLEKKKPQEKEPNKKSSILDLVLGNDESCNNIIDQPKNVDRNNQEDDSDTVENDPDFKNNLSAVLDMCNKIIADVSSLSKELEADSNEKADKEVQQDTCTSSPVSPSKSNRTGSKEVIDKDVPNAKEGAPNTCESPPFYPSENEGCGDFDDVNVSKDNLSIGNEDEIDNCEKDPSSDKSEKPTLKCVDIRKLLSSAIKESDSSTILKSPSKKPKNVTFLDKLVHIKKPKTDQDSRISTVNMSPTSILMNNDSKYANCWNNSSAIELTDSDDSDVSNTNRQLLKNIKNKILHGQSNTSVTLTRDSFYSDKYTGSLPKSHGIKRAYNEHGKVIFCQRQKKLIEDAKKSVLVSSSSDEDLIDPIRKKLLENSSGSGNDSDSESVDIIRVRRKKKKFSRKRRRKEDSDSDFDMKDILKFSKSKVRRKHILSEDSSQDKQNKSSDDEMGRSARLKQREAPAAFTQSSKERNESDSSSSSSLKNKSPKTTNETVTKESKLLKTSVNGDVKSSSDTDQSSTTDTSIKPINDIKPSKPDIPLSDKIKDDLLQEESSSSAQESSSVKLNGKNKKTPTNEEIKKVLIVDSDEEDEVEEEEDDDDEDVVECDDDDVSSSKRPGSTINLDTDSDDSIRVPKIKNKKTSGENGKKEKDEDLEKEDKSGNESNDSEVFAPAKRKRKAKKKSSSSGSEDDNSQDSESTEKKTKRKRIKKMSDDDDSSGDDGSEEENNRKGRKNIRALKKTSHLDSATREAAKKERERIARIAERQKLYNESMFDESGKPEEIAKLDKVVLDFDPKTREPIIALDKGLVQKLKPHQANGIKFMWNACFESVKQINSGKGSGCILAHCMGLGKTLQVVTLVHTLLLHREQTKVERVLVVCPLSTVLNWVNEFNMWLEHAEADEEINIFELSRYKQNHERAYQLKEWLECGGVCILGYDMFRNLSADNPKKFRKAQLSSFQKSLVDPGPDLVVCDEGHLLKNEKTSLSQSMNRVKTLRRIVLTGTPLQNNLKEYYCMVQFVKPNLLGKYSEYLNRFVNPITNGQYTNSTDQDIKLMKRRSHVLHKMLDGAVQRRDYAVLAPFLPPKQEYVLFISLTEIQIKLYRHYLENYSRRPNPEKKTTPSLFSDFQSLQRIWTHPLVLKANSERYELMLQKKRDKEEEEESEGSLVDFIDDEEDTTTPEESSVSESEDSDESDKPRKRNKNKKNNSKAKPKRVTRATAASQVKDDGDLDEDVVEVKMDEPKLENPTEWWMSLCSEEELNDIRHSNKLLLLLDILKECEAIGDKVLVFSQSLYSLDLIEQFLSKIDEATQKGSPEEHLGGHSGSWSQGLDYFRLDGSTSCENRAIWCKAFNREDNPRARLFLISTRAGGLGINLVAANRVVIFDVSWNPSHDVQSIFRVYRFGQKKPCYIYRFLALGTMEEKIYERQVTKQAISKRVIDEQQIDRHYTESDLAELYVFCPEPEGQREVPNLPKDRLFADILKTHDTVIYKYHEHDSLLENKEEETLSEEERKAAWEDYENEKKRPPQSFAGANWMLMQQQQQQQQMTINALQAVLRQDYPSLTEQQITAMIPAILQQMHINGDAAFTQKLNAMMAAQNNMLPSQMPGYKYNPNLMAQSMMMNPGGMGMGIRNPVYQQVWQQQQQQLQLQRLQQQQALQTNLKYYSGGLGSRDLMDMAAIQQQQRALLLGNALQPSTRGRPPKTILVPPRPISTSEIVDLDSE